MDFQKKLYTLRNQRKMSQEDLAEILGVSRQAVQKWEAGTASPDKNNLIALANFFEVSLDVLLKDDFPLEQPVSKAPKTPEISQPAAPYRSWKYEYKSTRTLFGLPLVHINHGYGFHMAKGIIAMGNSAIGLIAIGGLSLGLLSLGALSLGLLCALGGISFGGIAMGGVSVGIAACGGIACGVLPIGAVAIGQYAVGAVALGSKVAVGNVAKGYLTMGERLSGVVEISREQLLTLSPTEIEAIILREYPKLWRPLVTFLGKMIL